MAENGRNFGAVIGSLRRLLAVVAENIALLPDVTEEKDALIEALADAEEAKTRQDTLGAAKQFATREVNDAVARARDAGLQLQAAAKFKLGPRNENLIAFQVRPLRKRGPRPTQPVPPAPETQEPEEVKPAP